MKQVICLICRNNSHAKVLYPENFDRKALTSKAFSARRTPDRVHFQFLQCQKCGLIFSSPILPLKTITNLYKGSDFTYGEETSHLANTYGNYLEKLIPQTGREKIRLLDIGCGNGFFLEKAKEMGVGDVCGVEPGKASVLKAKTTIRKKITIDIFRPGLFKENYFDIICCFHTLDHIVEPHKFLQLVYKLVKEKGKILFVVHNTNGFSVKLFGEKSPIFDIEHIYLFNETTLFKVFFNNGFRNMHIYNLKNTYTLLYWVRLMPLPNGIKQSLLTTLNTTKIGYLPLSVSAGNIAITAEK